MKCVIQFITAILISGSLASDARSERVWQGHIHLVDCRMQLHFAGYEYGDLSDDWKADFEWSNNQRVEVK